MAWGRRSHEHCSSLILIKVIRMAQKNTEDQTPYFSNDILPSHKQHSPDMTSHSVELGIQWVSTEAKSQHSYSISYQIFFLDKSPTVHQSVGSVRLDQSGQSGWLCWWHRSVGSVRLNQSGWWHRSVGSVRLDQSGWWHRFVGSGRLDHPISQVGGICLLGQSG